MTDIKRILERNRLWADRIKEINPDYFENLSKDQTPQYLWIGCADSRVPASQISDLPPGELFVHRNIANVVVPSDLNCLAVLQYGVWELGVKHIIVCGHYGCGGVRAALSDEAHGLIDNWLNHIRVVKRLHADRFTEDLSAEAAANVLCELNVIEQVNNVCNTTVVRGAWDQGNQLTVHGFIYSLKNGIIKEMVAHSAADR